MDTSILNQNEVSTTALDFTRLAQLRESSRSSETDSNKEVAQQFESLFVNMMLQAMRKATNKSELLNSQASQTYEQLFDEEIATKLSKTGSFGIAEAIERQIQITQRSDASSSNLANNTIFKQKLPVNAEAHDPFPLRQKPRLQLYKEAE